MSPVRLMFLDTGNHSVLPTEGTLFKNKQINFQDIRTLVIKIDVSLPMVASCVQHGIRKCFNVKQALCNKSILHLDTQIVELLFFPPFSLHCL